MSCSRSASGQSVTVGEMTLVFMHFTNNEKRNHEKLGCFNKAVGIFGEAMAAIN
jgi:hypothetical protein